MDLSKEKIMLIDNGLFPALAEKCAESFGEVLYFSHWKNQFSKSKQAIIGKGFKNVTRIENIWDHIDEVNTFCFPDCGDGDIQRELKAQGKAVWGSDEGEELELDRTGYRKLATKLNMDMPKNITIKGVEALKKNLKGTKNRYVKIAGKYRGDMETFHHDDDDTSEPFLKNLEYRLGAMANNMEFIIDDAVGEIEPGYDGFTIDGQFPEIAGWGYEIKDKSYVGKVSYYKNMPRCLTETNAKLAPIFQKLNYNGFYSSEVRVDKGNKFYLMDICSRAGNPPLDVMLELYNNWGEIIYQGARGILVNPKPTARYCAMAIIQSEWSDKEWQTISFPEKDKRWYKFKNVVNMDGKYWIVPMDQGLYEIGSVVGIGSTLNEAIEKVKKYSDNLKGYDVEVKTHALNEAKETIEKGKKFGINF
jgi:hypothetical protein